MWSNFLDDMAVLELCFPVTSTMEQSDRAEKLDAIYTYEAQLRNVHSNGVKQAPCVNVLSGQDPACDCCFSFLHGISSPRMGSPEQFSGADSMSPRSSSGFLREPRYGTDSACQLQPNYVSTPVSSRRTYAGIPSLLSEDCGFYSRQDLPRCRPLIATRKRSSSFPTRKHGRRSSGSKDHLKTGTESFLDELINTANEEKHSKKRNSRGEVTAPEIKCELDFPSLPSTNPVPCSNKTSPLAKVCWLTKQLILKLVQFLYNFSSFILRTILQKHRLIGITPLDHHLLGQLKKVKATAVVDAPHLRIQLKIHPLMLTTTGATEFP